MKYTPLKPIILSLAIVGWALVALSGCRSTGTQPCNDCGLTQAEPSGAERIRPTTLVESINSEEKSESESGSTVQQVAFIQDSSESSTAPSVIPQNFEDPQRYAVDLATVLQLAGSDNWNVRIARERVKQACLDLESARAEILPSLNFGMVYNVHAGPIQTTGGPIIDTSRNSFFLGGGAGLANSPINGGAGGPPRLFVDFSLADAFFQPLIANQRLSAAKADRCRVFNDTMLEATLAYYELVRAQSLVSVANKNLSEANDLLLLTSDFVEGGKGSQADVHRARTIANRQRQQLIRASGSLEVASARLREILQLDPCELDSKVGLIAVEYHPVPIDINDWDLSLDQQIDLAQQSRCEITKELANSAALNSEYESELWRALLPNLYVGYSGGFFGGGPTGGYSGLSYRNDFDLGATWQIRNLGVGERIARSSAKSRYKEQVLVTRQIRDRVTQQVSTAYHTARQFQNELDLLSDNVLQASQALAKNLDAIKSLEGLPLEAAQSINDLALARVEYLNSVINYNQWQLRLLRATGQSFADPGDCCSRCNCLNCNGKCTSLSACR